MARDFPVSGHGNGGAKAGVGIERYLANGETWSPPCRLAKALFQFLKARFLVQYRNDSGRVYEAHSASSQSSSMSFFISTP